MSRKGGGDKGQNKQTAIKDNGSSERNRKEQNTRNGTESEGKKGTGRGRNKS